MMAFQKNSAVCVQLMMRFTKFYGWEKVQKWQNWTFYKNAFRLLPVHPADQLMLGTDSDECDCNFQQIFKELCVPFALAKCECPAAVLTFLGIEIDIVKRVAPASRKAQTAARDNCGVEGQEEVLKTGTTVPYRPTPTCKHSGEAWQRFPESNDKLGLNTERAGPPLPLELCLPLRS